jgi:hypothetical protein
MERDERNLKVYRPGLFAFTSPKGIRVVVLRLNADPELHTPEWERQERTKYLSKDWRREMEGDWTTPAGEPYFPIFQELGRDRYIHTATEILKGPVIRSYDFGRRYPACTWFQYSPQSDRVWLYREFMPQDLQTHEFRDCVRHLSGQLGYDTLSSRSRRWIDAYAAKPSASHCPPPWFPTGTHFIDIGGKELLQGGASAVDPELATARAIFAEKDMYLAWVNPRVEGRNRIVDRMLMLRPDGHPGTFIDPQCEEMIEGFEGRFSYPRATQGTPFPDHPNDDGHYINLLDAWGYGVAAVCPVETPKDTQRLKLVGYRDGREPVYINEEDEVGWNETRPRL